MKNINESVSKQVKESEAPTIAVINLSFLQKLLWRSRRYCQFGFVASEESGLMTGTVRCRFIIS